MMPIAELRHLLRQSASRETSFTPDRWSPKNPHYGHCATFTLVVQDILGGKIRRALLPQDWGERLGYRSHYWNVLDNGWAVDCSREQFPQDFPYHSLMNGTFGDSSDTRDKREYLLGNKDTMERHTAIRERVEGLLRDNPIFLDKKFQHLWELAFSEEATCAQTHFACLVCDGDELIVEDVNRSMAKQFGRERFCVFDGSWCRRKEIQSRVDPTIGDCGHAPLWCLKKVFELGYLPSFLPHLDFYEAGFQQDFSPWLRLEPTYTCIYCQNMFAVFGLDKIWGVFDGKWTKLLTIDSFYSSGEYAEGKKKC